MTFLTLCCAVELWVLTEGAKKGREWNSNTFYMIRGDNSSVLISSETTVLPMVPGGSHFPSMSPTAAAVPSSGPCSMFSAVRTSAPALVHPQDASSRGLHWSSPKDLVQPKVILMVYRVCSFATLLKEESKCLIRENFIKKLVEVWKKL